MASGDLEGALSGLWAMHPSRRTLFGGERYRRRPTSYIAFDGSGWRLFHTAYTRRLRRCTTSEGVWNILPSRKYGLLVLTVNSYHPSPASKAILESSYSYSGGFMVVMAARTQREREDMRMRGGEVQLYFLPVHVPLHRQPGEILMALPSDGQVTPRQRWVRLE